MPRVVDSDDDEPSTQKLSTPKKPQRHRSLADDESPTQKLSTPKRQHAEAGLSNGDASHVRRRLLPEDEDDASSGTCPVCKVMWVEDGSEDLVGCDGCGAHECPDDHWAHLSCTKFRTAAEAEEGSWQCPPCRRRAKQPQPASSGAEAQCAVDDWDGARIETASTRELKELIQRGGL
eukprot:2747352-Prymnesium_polylepis.1